MPEEAFLAPRCVAAWPLSPRAAPAALERLAWRLVAATRAADRPGMVWLDSGGPALSPGSESVLTAFPVARHRLAADGAARVPELLHAIAGRNETTPGTLRFQGGWVGFLGYEASSGLEPVGLTARRDLGVPLASWARYPTWFRHHPASARLELWTRHADADDLAGWTAHADAAVQGQDALATDREPVPRALAERIAEHAERSFTRAAFEAAVQTVQRAVREGEVFQANLAHRLRVETAADPFSVYVVLRRLNPSPFALFLEEDWGALVSNSPERLFCVRWRDGKRRVEARPIAGTRPRGSDPATDAAHAAALVQSAKERAEHTMLVDLARNDIGRVAVPGSVRVATFQSVEAYSHVHHLVSRVEGTLRDEVTLVDVARALFPGGTITGAPKLRSMEVIDRVERVARGPYTGSAGYVNPDGSLDWNILIRTLVMTRHAAYAYVGAGIVADSEPGREYEETLHKAAAMLVAIATADPGLVRVRLPEVDA